MFKRRPFIKANSLLIASGLFEYHLSANSKRVKNSFYMPDESHPHKRTWMAYVANPNIWSKKQIPEVKKNLAHIANTISKYEPVSILVHPSLLTEAKKLFNTKSSKYSITLHSVRIDDLWLRDTGPTFVKNPQGKKVALDFNFNGWGNKQEHTHDKRLARYIAKQSNSIYYKSQLVLEGGSIEVDGYGTAIMTKSSIINSNRNPRYSFNEIDKNLKATLGLKKIIWLDGIKGKDITDAHIDFYARFSKPGEVIVSKDNYEASYDYKITRQNIRTLKKSTDAKGKRLKLHIIETPEVINEQYGSEDFAAGYIGYYLCNGAVIAQKFGDHKQDRKAYKMLKKAYPGRVIEQIQIDGIASGGGSVHCATQQEFLD